MTVTIAEDCDAVFAEKMLTPSIDSRHRRSCYASLLFRNDSEPTTIAFIDCMDLALLPFAVPALITLPILA